MPSEGETLVENVKNYSEELQLSEDRSTSPIETLRSSAGAKIDRIGIYKLGKTLGRGSFCKVKLATHAISGQQFAVKIMKVFESNTKKWYEIEREIEALRKLNHPNIIKMYQVLYTDEDDLRTQTLGSAPKPNSSPSPACVLYMVMELAEGGELFDHIIKHGRLCEEEARRLFRQIVSAVEYMHAHLVVHRDLKPENIVLDAHKNVKINDFGLSNFVNPGMRMNTFCGSPVYAAPEILRKKNYDGPSVDIWSLGVLLFTMVTGHLPWKPSPNSVQNIHDMLMGKFIVPFGITLSPDCMDILRKMLCPDMKKRATANQLRHHPWLNVGFHEPPPIYLEPYPPVTQIDNNVVKQMAQMNYSPRKVQEVLQRNETGPILTIYHTLKSLVVNHDGSLVRAFPPNKPASNPSRYVGPWLQSFALKTSEGMDRIHQDMTESHTRKNSFSFIPISSSASSSSSSLSGGYPFLHSVSMPVLVTNKHPHNHHNHHSPQTNGADHNLSISLGMPKVPHSKSDEDLAEMGRRRALSDPFPGPEEELDPDLLLGPGVDLIDDVDAVAFAAMPPSPPSSPSPSPPSPTILRASEELPRQNTPTKLSNIFIRMFTRFKPANK